ncbi:Mss4-like protein [Xylariaceae sp. FL0662B]|nr:Mss4-like protein [Xylariaceae sp. FL0662B]
MSIAAAAAASATTSSPPPSSRTGSCLCGAIQLRVEGNPVRTNLCHCVSCQKSTGVVFASMAAYPLSQFTMTATPPTALRTYSDASPESGRVLERSFCGVCGSRVVITAQGRDIAAVPVGVLDGAKADLRPKVEFFCRNREPWLGDTGAEIVAAMP